MHTRKHLSFTCILTETHMHMHAHLGIHSDDFSTPVSPLQEEFFCYTHTFFPWFEFNKVYCTWWHSRNVKNQEGHDVRSCCNRRRCTTCRKPCQHQHSPTLHVLISVHESSIVSCCLKATFLSEARKQCPTKLYWVKGFKNFSTNQIVLV